MDSEVVAGRTHPRDCLPDGSKALVAGRLAPGGVRGGRKDKESEVEGERKREVEEEVGGERSGTEGHGGWRVGRRDRERVVEREVGGEMWRERWGERDTLRERERGLCVAVAGHKRMVQQR